ncbi:MAG: SpoIIE family protein phosphatase [Bacteroidetes bacterium]|nr:SpoIIE family protein phosphatase [Bacteroidota bacterium]
MRELKITITLVLAFVFQFNLLSQTSYPDVKKFSRQLLTNYSQREYGDSCSAQNWAVTQDYKGIMYFGNAYRVLEFDGVSWDAIRIPLHGVYVSALHADSNGNIFVGANGEFGLLKNDKTGKKYYVSLSDSLEIQDSFFSTIWRIFEYNSKILFFAQEGIYLWDGQSIEVIIPETSFHLAFVVNEELFVRQRGAGLMKYEDGKLQLIQNGDIFKNYGVFGMFPGENDNILIVTQEIGLYNMEKTEGETSISQIKGSYHNYLNNAQIIGGQKLHDGLIALNTLRNGVIIIDFKGNIKQIIDQNSGLRDNEVKQIFQDNNNQLWLALNTGISMVNYNSGIWVYDYNTGLFGNIQTVAIHKNRIFVGTSIGLFQKSIYPSDKIFKFFNQIEGFNISVHEMISIGNTLVIGSKEGLFGWEYSKGIFKIADIDASAIYWSAKRKLLFACGEDGFFIFTNNPRWTQKAGYEELAVANPLNIAENISYEGENTELWIGSLSEGAWNLIIKPNLSYELDIFMGAEANLEQTWVKPFMTENNVLFGVAIGLMRFVDEKEIISTLTDSLPENAVAMRGFFQYVDVKGLDSVAVIHFQQNHNKFWICRDNKIYFGNALDNLNDKPFRTLDMGRIYTMLPTDSTTLWLATDDGLVKIGTNKRTDFSGRPIVNIRNIKIGNDSILFHSFDSRTHSEKIYLPYAFNKITINYASIFEENHKKALYSFMLEGFDTQWSDWTSLTYREYANLREGDYTFWVKAKDAYDNESEMQSFSFRISPPWYRTIWAFLLYAVIIILIVLLIVKLSIMRLKAKNIQLEKIIEKRTEEIRNQKDEIAKQHKIVVQQKEAITSSIKYASRIQNALVPQEDFLKQHLKDSFILYQPKDIVSGDFYWIKHTPPYLSIVAADCTGHGVPGAFMSMLGIAFLNEVAQREDPGKVSTVLEHLRVYMKNTLGQTGDRYEQKDGIVLALCTLNIETNTLYFAGANTPLWLIRNNELIEYTAIRNPIGIHPKEMPFEAHTIEIQNGDAFYLFSDGYVDQFGGPDDQRIGKRAFRELLLEIHKNPMNKQKELLDLHLKNWMGEEFSQIDDILVMGFRV